MRHLRSVLSFSLAAVWLGAALSAQEAPGGGEAAAPSPRPARELFTTSAGVTDPGVALLNAGVQAASYRDGSQAQRYPAQVDLGICQWFDLRASWNGPTTLKDPQGNQQRGGADPWFGGQAQALHQDLAGVDLGLAYWHKVPRASVEKGIGTGKPDDTALLTVSRTFGALELDVNAGANWLGQAGSDHRARQGLASLAATRAFGAGWNLSLDTYALAAAAGTPRTLTSILAVTRDVTPDLTLDLGVEGGWTREGERAALDAGLVWRIGRLWGKDK